MGKTFKDMHDMRGVMTQSDAAFRRDYWQGKGAELGERKPKSIIHPPRHQPTVVEALRECDGYDTVRLAFNKAGVP